ncbi:MAG: bifunctional acetate--CoA ligase family protein/GNAT family N-acetyltransferase [Alphaproteobacteria bacterium]|nr:bifunctional acetate--CoA ligase family protein/GNAT family N-acetyltransferase [Alphaproteobacteria bacterium]
MSIRNLEALFAPRSIAVIGASNRATSVGGVVFRNLVAGGFAGPLLPVNPKQSAVAGVLAYPNVELLPLVPDLAVLCTPAATVPGLIAALAARGTRAAIVLSAGLDQPASDGRPMALHMLEAARPTLMRVLGPNCLGLSIPPRAINATFAHAQARPGPLAFISQSGALCTAALDMANTRGIGFSAFVSLGNSADIDVADCLDYLANDPETRAILLYLEAIKAPRKFMSAARAAARNKPVVAIKAGRAQESAAAAFSHTGALAGTDDVYDAALRRAGVLRVYDTQELFAAVETLARAAPIAGDRLAILTNGGGPGVMAADALITEGGRLAPLSATTIAALNACLPANWSRANPVDIIGDADGARFGAAIAALRGEPAADALLILHAPTAISSSEDVARSVVAAMAGESRPVLTNWLGGQTEGRARLIAAEAGLPGYDTPEEAVRAFLHLVNHKRNRDLLAQVPPAAASRLVRDQKRVHALVVKARTAGRLALDEPTAKTLLTAYGIPTVPTSIAASPDAAAALAQEFGCPVALKILSPDISHKTDVGGVVLDLATPEDVRAAAVAMLARVRQHALRARLEGFTVQAMARRPRAIELIVGATSDPVFGPVVLFGHGGRAVEVLRDRAVALPPLNEVLAQSLIDETRVSRLLAGFRDQPASDLAAIRAVLISVATLILDHPEIVELDINPLWADAQGVMALDARIRLAAEGAVVIPSAIRPYPDDLEEILSLPGGGTVFVRPIRPEDEPAHAELLRALAPEDIRARFFGAVGPMAHDQLARYTQIDYDREMAFIVLAQRSSTDTLAVIRAVSDPDQRQAEFAIVVRPDRRRRGLGRALLAKLIAYANARGLGELFGLTRPENRAMISLTKALGFTVQRSGDDMLMSLKLRSTQSKGS